ncbi:OmpA family protein [Poseidonibacter lekithochrous]|uniref:OmpA family protein n=1 Tax=Poseidonibacter TaxID=2321187 RepID=UPI001C093AB0|nr:MULTISPECIES: OmpA family protein [Poseidonibacter]MBU3014343.1 OmpA family protein [Poseidonibacter lekithochrous]MDO6827641.1 OmpA family protein [Poseidonibacter sp. 1_MG-2023]
MKKVIISTLVGFIGAASLSAADCIMVKDLNVQFKNASTVYADSSEMKEIREYAQFLKQTDLYTVIEGHTSSLSGAKYNYDLSTRRAAKVKAELIKLGVPSSRVKAMGFGESTPLYNNNTESGAAQNRRVVGEVFNTSTELSNYIANQKTRIATTKFQEQ